jgi:predicted dehydrogenase
MPLPYEIYPNFIRAKELIEQGVIGQVSSCDGIFSHQGSLHAPWFFDKRLAQWGVMADLGVYPLGILAYLLGPFKAISDKVEILCPERKSLTGESVYNTVEDNAVAILEWGNGILGTIRTNWCTVADKSGCIYSITISGSTGIIYLTMLSHELILYSPGKPVPGAKQIKYLGFEESYLINVAPYDDHLNILQSYYDAHDTHVVP